MFIILVTDQHGITYPYGHPHDGKPFTDSLAAEIWASAVRRILNERSTKVTTEVRPLQRADETDIRRTWVGA